MNRRGFLGGLAATAIAGVAAGCGKSSDKGAEGSTDKAKISFATWNTDTAALVNDNIGTFHAKHPGIEVDVQVSPHGSDYWTKLQTQASSGTAPDVFWMNGPHFQLYAANGQIDPLDEMIADGSVDPAKFPKPLVDLYTYNGKVYGLPTEYAASALWFNRAIFAAAGEKLPTDAWTWEDFTGAGARISEKLRGKGIFGIAVAADGEQSYYNSIKQAGGFVISEDGMKSGFGEPGSVAGLKLWADLMQNGTSPTIQQLNDSPADEWFINGKAAMMQGAAFNVATFGESPHADKFQVVRMAKKQSNVSVVHGVAPMISSKSKNKAAARAFLAWICGPDYATKLAARASTIPGLAGTEGPYLNSHPEWKLKVFLDAAREGYPYPVSKNTAAWNNLETALLPDLWSGKATAEQTGKELATKMDAELAKG